MDEVRLGSRTLQPHRQLLVNGRREPIGKRALDILSVLAGARGGIVTKDELLGAVWPGVIVEENALQVHIVALRKALGPEAERLKTIRGVGYQLDVDNEIADGTLAEPTPPDPAASRGPEPAPEPVHDLSVPVPASVGSRGPGRLPGATWAWARAHRWAVLAAGVLALLAGGWALFGSDLGLRPKERIPVLVHTLEASGRGDQTEAALADGITEELISRLRRLPGLKIATAEADGSAPSSAFDRAYQVDGTISSADGRVRVAVRLSDPQGEILWSQTLDRGMADLFGMQEEIAAAIAGALSVSFEVGANAPQYGGTDNPEAYAAYVQYWAHAIDFDQDVPQRYLERAVALDPKFGKAIGGLVLIYGNRIVSAGSEEQAEDLLARMDAASAGALAANPERWFGQAARGWYFLSRRNFTAAEKQMRRVAELDPNDDPELRLHLATYATHLGRVREGISLRDSRELIDPIYQDDPWKVFDLTMTGRYDDAISLFEKLDRNEAENLQPFIYSAYWSYLLAGREDEAETLLERFDVPFKDGLRDMRANTSILSMSRPELRHWADERSWGDQISLSAAAAFAAYDGHDRLAVELLRLAYERPGGFVLLLLWHPALANARKTDEFEQFVTDLGLVKAWRASGNWGDYCHPVSNTEISCV